MISLSKINSIIIKLHFAPRIKVQTGNDKGLIYPPLLVIEYEELSANAIQANVMVPLHFSVTFEMENKVAHSIEVLICALHLLMESHLLIDILLAFL